MRNLVRLTHGLPAGNRGGLGGDRACSQAEVAPCPMPGTWGGVGCPTGHGVCAKESDHTNATYALVLMHRSRSCPNPRLPGQGHEPKVGESRAWEEQESDSYSASRGQLSQRFLGMPGAKGVHKKESVSHPSEDREAYLRGMVPRPKAIGRAAKVAHLQRRGKMGRRFGRPYVVVRMGLLLMRCKAGTLHRFS